MTDVSGMTISIIALGISLISLVFVIITEGSKHTIGYRSSEETRARKQRIETALSKEIDHEIDSFITKCSSEKRSKQDIKAAIVELGSSVYVSTNITDDLLDSLTYTMERGLRTLLSGAVASIITVLIPFYFDINNPLMLVMLFTYIAVDIYSYWKSFTLIRNNYSIKKKLILLDENPKMDYASEVFEELSEKDLI